MVPGPLWLPLFFSWGSDSWPLLLCLGYPQGTPTYTESVASLAA